MIVRPAGGSSGSSGAGSSTDPPAQAPVEVPADVLSTSKTKRSVFLAEALREGLAKEAAAARAAAEWNKYSVEYLTGFKGYSLPQARVIQKVEKVDGKG